MSNIIVRRNNGNRGELSSAGPQWDPFRSLFRWDPFREMTPAWPEDQLAFAPAFEVKENKDGFVITADVPGVKDGDLEISVTGQRLNVSGKREAEKQDKGETFFCYERSYGSFARAFTLPEGIDAEHVRAELKAGVLTISLPKKAELMPRKITVKSGETSKS